MGLRSVIHGKAISGAVLAAALFLAPVPSPAQQAPLQGGVSVDAPSGPAAPTSPTRRGGTRQSHAICGQYAAGLDPAAGRLHVIPKTSGGGPARRGPQPSYCYTSFTDLRLLGEDGNYCCYLQPGRGRPPLRGVVRQQPPPALGGGVDTGPPPPSGTGPLRGNTGCGGAGQPPCDTGDDRGPPQRRPDPGQEPRQDPRQDPRQTAGTGPIFNFFYINGINTPYGGAPRGGGDPGGSYEYEYGRVKAALALSPATRVVWNEIDLMAEPSHNLSGKDQLFQTLLHLCQGWTPGGGSGAGGSGGGVAGTVAGAVTDAVCGLNEAWQGGGLAWGDIFECLVQSLRSPFTGIEKTAQQVEVVEVADRIAEIYRQERAQGPGARPNFFIVVAHSQGNFFAEGVAFRLFNPPLVAFPPLTDGPAIAGTRLAILSLGSPTRYDSLPVAFRAQKLGHVTRADDAIHVLDALAQGAGAALFFKRPFPRADDVAALWPWQRRDLDRLFGTLGGFFEVKDFLNLRGVVPLTTPFMNAHLVDNYLNLPTPTVGLVPAAARALPAPARDMLGAAAAPQGVPVLFEVQQAVRDLKHALLATYAGR